MAVSEAHHCTMLETEGYGMNFWTPQSQVFWYLKQTPEPACHENVSADVAIIGGGMAGLSAAHAFHKRGKKVVVLEQYYCGSGATGKSSGFITPNAELSFTDFSQLYTPEIAHSIWNFIISGVEDIRQNIQQYGFACDYMPSDTLMVANTRGALKQLETEYHNLRKFGYKAELYTQDDLRNQLNSNGYFGGIGYLETFGIDGYAYCQEMKHYLQQHGVMIFEETAVTAINDHCLTTAHAQITADYVVVCTDRWMPELGLLTQDVYHAQNVVMISEPLTDVQVKAIFPQKNLLVWDSDLLYNYFRLTTNKQLLLGGGNFLTLYASKPTYEPTHTIKRLARYFDAKFPGLNIQFKQAWPGLIGVSKDIMPLAGRDKERPFLYYATAAAGLPIAAALGRYSAEHLLDGRTDLDSYFSPYRSFRIGGLTQSIIGSKLTFALCHGIQKLLL